MSKSDLPHLTGKTADILIKKKTDPFTRIRRGQKVFLQAKCPKYRISAKVCEMYTFCKPETILERFCLERFALGKEKEAVLEELKAYAQGEQLLVFVLGNRKEVNRKNREKKRTRYDRRLRP